MANMCFNSLEIIGPIDKLKEFDEKFKAKRRIGTMLTTYITTYTLRNVTDVVSDDPESLERLWGNSHDIANVSKELSGNVLSYVFSTSWRPVVEAIKHIATENKDFDITYVFDEDSEEFAGIVKYEKGNLIMDIESYCEDTKEYRNFKFKYDIDEFKYICNCGCYLRDSEVEDPDDCCPHCYEDLAGAFKKISKEDNSEVI